MMLGVGGGKANSDMMDSKTNPSHCTNAHPEFSGEPCHQASRSGLLFRSQRGNKDELEIVLLPRMNGRQH